MNAWKNALNASTSNSTSRAKAEVIMGENFLTPQRGKQYMGEPGFTEKQWAFFEQVPFTEVTLEKYADVAVLVMTPPWNTYGLYCMHRDILGHQEELFSHQFAIQKARAEYHLLLMHPFEGNFSDEEMLQARLGSKGLLLSDAFTMAYSAILHRLFHKGDRAYLFPGKLARVADLSDAGHSIILGEHNQSGLLCMELDEPELIKSTPRIVEVAHEINLHTRED